MRAMPGGSEPKPGQRAALRAGLTRRLQARAVHTDTRIDQPGDTLRNTDTVLAYQADPLEGKDPGHCVRCHGLTPGLPARYNGDCTRQTPLHTQGMYENSGLLATVWNLGYTAVSERGSLGHTSQQGG